MKKVVLASIIAATSLIAASDKQIENFYSEMVDGSVKVKVTDRHKVAGDIEGVIVNLSKDGNSQDEIVFTKGDYIFPDVIDLKEQKSFLADMKKEVAAKGISKIYKEEDRANIITLGSDPKKPTLIMFSDPECPYCRAELAKIETTLKDNNVEIILTPVHDISSWQKSALIYKEAREAKSDSDKVKILRKYFAEDYNVDEKSVGKAQSDKIDNLRKKYFAAGVRSVPFIVNKSDLK
jgi:hypothetical protein